MAATRNTHRYQVINPRLWYVRIALWWCYDDVTMTLWYTPFFTTGSEPLYHTYYHTIILVLLYYHTIKYHTITLSHYHTIILSHYHTIILSHYHTIILYYHTITLSHSHTITLSHYHTIILSHSHTLTLSSYHNMILSHYNTIVLSYYHTNNIKLYTIILSYHHTTIPSHYHTRTRVPLYRTDKILVRRYCLAPYSLPFHCRLKSQGKKSTRGKPEIPKEQGRYSRSSDPAPLIPGPQRSPPPP